MATLPSTYQNLLGLGLGRVEPERLEAKLGIGPIQPARVALSRSKRAMDLVAASAGLVLLVPVLALVAMLVRVESTGPILFRQPRKGLGGRVFTCLKFRTMVPDAEDRLRDLEASNEAVGGVLFKIRRDPRITPLGRFLRKTSLDELPQLWNVLLGEMSLVGPRPLQLRDSERLAGSDPEGYASRLAARPGITGPWQVGGRSATDSDRMVQLDLDYVDRWTLATDLSILLKTVVVVAVGKGAC